MLWIMQMDYDSLIKSLTWENVLIALLQKEIDNELNFAKLEDSRISENIPVDTKPEKSRKAVINAKKRAAKKKNAGKKIDEEVDDWLKDIPTVYKKKNYD